MSLTILKMFKFLQLSLTVNSSIIYEISFSISSCSDCAYVFSIGNGPEGQKRYTQANE